MPCPDRAVEKVRGGTRFPSRRLALGEGVFFCCAPCHTLERPDCAPRARNNPIYP